MLPVRSTWKNAAAYVSASGFEYKASLEFALTQLLLCKKIILRHEMGVSFGWSNAYAYMHLPAIAECNVLDVSGTKIRRIQPGDLVQWLEHDVPPEKKCSEPRQMILHEDRIIRGIEGLVTALKTVGAKRYRGMMGLLGVCRNSLHLPTPTPVPLNLGVLDVQPSQAVRRPHSPGQQ